MKSEFLKSICDVPTVCAASRAHTYLLHSKYSSAEKLAIFTNSMHYLFRAVPVWLGTLFDTT